MESFAEDICFCDFHPHEAPQGLVTLSLTGANLIQLSDSHFDGLP